MSYLARRPRRTIVIQSAVVNESSSARLYLFCGECRTGVFRWSKAIDWDSDDRFPRKFGKTIVVTCHSCAAILTLTTARIPELFVPEAYQCSPDGSAAAAWIPPGEAAPTYWLDPPAPAPPPPTPEPEPDELDELRNAAQRMREIIALHAQLKEEFCGEEEFLEELDRIIENKKRDIKRTEPLDESDVGFVEYDDN